MSLRTRRLNFAFEGPDWGPLQPIGQCRICILKVFATLFQLKKSMLIVGGMFSKSSQLIDEMTSWTPTDWRDDGLNTEGTACLVPTIERAVTLCAHSFSEDFFENQTSSLSNSKRLKRKLKPNCFKDSPVTAFCTINGKTRSDFTWHANLQIRRGVQAEYPWSTSSIPTSVRAIKVADGSRFVWLLMDNVVTSFTDVFFCFSFLFHGL